MKNTLWAFVIKGGALLVSLAATPAYIKFFNDNTVLGLWYTILSVLNWVMNFDFGIGNGLRNSLVKYLEAGDKDGVKKSVSSAFVSIGLITLIFLVIGGIASPFIPWNSLFNISTDLVSAKMMIIAMVVAFVGLMGQFFLKTTNSIFYAIQKSSANNFLALVSSVGMLIFVLVFPNNHGAEYNLIAMSVANTVICNLPLIVATIWIFTKSLRYAMPRLKDCKKSFVKEILTIGGLFLYCQILYMLIMNTNEFVILKFLSADLVVDYQIYFKLFSLTGTVFMLALTPVWSAITKAQQQKDYGWLMKSYKLLNLASIVGFFLQFLIIPLLPFIMKIWLGDSAPEVNYLYAIIFAIYGGVFVWQTALSTVVCGLGRMKLQAICYSVGFVVRIVIIYLGIRFFNSWITVIAASAIIFVPYIILEGIFTSRYLKKHMADLPTTNSYDIATATDKNSENVSIDALVNENEIKADIVASETSASVQETPYTNTVQGDDDATDKENV